MGRACLGKRGGGDEAVVRCRRTRKKEKQRKQRRFGGVDSIEDFGVYNVELSE